MSLHLHQNIITESKRPDVTNTKLARILIRGILTVQQIIDIEQFNNTDENTNPNNQVVKSKKPSKADLITQKYPVVLACKGK